MRANMVEAGRSLDGHLQTVIFYTILSTLVHV